MAKAKHEYRYHQVHYSDGTQGSLRIKRGTLASPEFWEAVEAAKADGAAYCGHGNHAVAPGGMARKFQCSACAAVRMDQKRFTTYRPPRARQSLDAIRGHQSAAYAPTSYRENASLHRELYDQYRAEDAEREARRAEALQLSEEVERASTDVEEPPILDSSTEPDYGLYAPEVAERMRALRKELGIE